MTIWQDSRRRITEFSQERERERERERETETERDRERQRKKVLEDWNPFPAAILFFGHSCVHSQHKSVTWWRVSSHAQHKT
jgi:hypothetical protein